MSHRIEKKKELVGNLESAYQRLREDMNKVLKKCTPNEKRMMDCANNELTYAIHRLKTITAM